LCSIKRSRLSERENPTEGIIERISHDDQRSGPPKQLATADFSEEAQSSSAGTSTSASSIADNAYFDFTASEPEWQFNFACVDGEAQIDPKIDH